MGHVVPVEVGDVKFYVEVADAAAPRGLGLDGALSFEGVRETLESIGSQLVESFKVIKPTEASVEFGLSLTAKSGKLTGLIVEGGGSASLKVTLTWKST